MAARIDPLINPFRRIAGLEALLAGFGIMLLGALVAWLSHTHFDGVLDSHTGHWPAPGWLYLAEPFIAWACAVIVFGLVALAGTGPRFRLIDLAGTLALCRAPMIIAAALGFAVPPQTDPLHPDPIVFILALPLLAICVWTVALMWHAFRVSVNPRPGRVVLLFTLALLLAEVVSKLLFHFLYKSIAL